MPISFINNIIRYVQNLSTEIVNAVDKFKYSFIASILIFIVAASFYLKLTVTNYQLNGALFVNSERIYSDDEILKLIDSLRSSTIFQDTAKEIRNNRLKPPPHKENEENALSLEYLKNLDISPGQNPNTIIFSLKNSDPQTAMIFIDQVVDLYIRKKKEIIHKLPKLIGDSVKILHKQLLATQQKINTNFTISTDSSLKISEAESERKVSILNQIQFYANKSLKAFVVIPDAYITNGNKLKSLIDNFNAIQFEKQKTISTQGANSFQVIEIEKRLYQLQNVIGKEILAQRNSLKYSSQAHLSASHSNTISDLKLKQRTLQSRIDSLQIRQSIARIRASQTFVPIISRSDFDVEPFQPNSIYIYISSVLIGFLIPLSVIYIRKRSVISKA